LRGFLNDLTTDSLAITYPSGQALLELELARLQQVLPQVELQV
jgi:hypothetical protein